MSDLPVLTFHNALTRLQGFRPETNAALAHLLAQEHARLAQLDRPPSERTYTARNYDSSIRAAFAYLQGRLPTRSLLAEWRDAMLHGRVIQDNGSPYSIATINARLAAMRRLLRAVADNLTDLEAKIALRDWAGVEQARPIEKQDALEADYGRRFSLEALTALVNNSDTGHVMGLRDRALLAVMAGAGLRVSEAVALNIGDVGVKQPGAEKVGVLVRQGKRGKQRVSVLEDWQSWVLVAVREYVAAMTEPQQRPGAPLFVGVARVASAARYAPTGKRLSARSAIRAIASYPVQYLGEAVSPSSHDLRRTYARLCREHGMAWEALQANLGHKSIVQTQQYVGKAVDWGERAPGWSVALAR